MKNIVKNTLLRILYLVISVSVIPLQALSYENDRSSLETATPPLHNSEAEEGVQVGDFTVIGGTKEVDYAHSAFEPILEIRTATPLIIKNTNPEVATQYSIAVRGQTGETITANLTLDNVNIDLSAVAQYRAPLYIYDNQSVNITLADGSNNVLTASLYRAGIAVDPSNSVTIDGTGSLKAVGGGFAAGIGGNNSHNAGNITIKGGNIEAIGGVGGAGIGGARGWSAGSITISGGLVTATKTVSNSFPIVADIGGGSTHNHGAFSTGENGNAIIYGSIGDRNNIASWNGFIFEDKINGSTHGKPVTLTEDIEIPSGKTLNVNPTWSFHVPSGLTFTNNGTINNQGTITIDGILENNGVLYHKGETIVTGSISGNGSFYTNDITDENIEGIPDQNFTSGEIKPTINIIGTRMLFGKEFTCIPDGWDITYENNISAGMATAKLTKGSQTITKTFNIVPYTGDFTVVGGVIGRDYSFAGDFLTVITNEPIEIFNVDKNTPTVDRIIVNDNVNANITLSGVKIDVSSGPEACAFYIGNASSANVILKGENMLKSGENRAGLEVSSGRSLTVSQNSTGSLTATGGHLGAGIGGSNYKGIDGQGDAGSITINGGTINAISGNQAAGIGGGHGGRRGNIVISGGTVTATTDTPQSYGAIGGWIGVTSSDGGTFRTTENGNAWIVTNNAISDQLGKDEWQGVIFEGDNGFVYGGLVTLTMDATVQSSQTLSIQAGSTLDISAITLTNNGKVEKFGAISSGGTLLGKNIMGDATSDRRVDRLDLMNITESANYNKATADADNKNADINGDGKVNFADLALTRNSKYFGR